MPVRVPTTKPVHAQGAPAPCQRSPPPPLNTSTAGPPTRMLFNQSIDIVENLGCPRGQGERAGQKGMVAGQHWSQEERGRSCQTEWPAKARCATHFIMQEALHTLCNGQTEMQGFTCPPSLHKCPFGFKP